MFLEQNVIRLFIEKGVADDLLILRHFDASFRPVLYNRVSCIELTLSGSLVDQDTHYSASEPHLSFITVYEI